MEPISSHLTHVFSRITTREGQSDRVSNGTATVLQWRLLPRGPHLQASRLETIQSEAASVLARTAPLPSSSAVRTYSNHTAWPKSTASRGCCHGGASCVSSSSSSTWSVMQTTSNGTLTYHIRIIALFGSVAVSSCVCRGTVK